MASAIKKDDRVVKRGLGHKGKVVKLGCNPKWIYVEWDEGFKAIERPRICYSTELEVIKDDA